MQVHLKRARCLVGRAVRQCYLTSTLQAFRYRGVSCTLNFLLNTQERGPHLAPMLYAANTTPLTRHYIQHV